MPCVVVVVVIVVVVVLERRRRRRRLNERMPRWMMERAERNRVK
jgi:cytochrome c-type biogenesis protein CcmH/NrfF